MARLTAFIACHSIPPYKHSAFEPFAENLLQRTICREPFALNITAAIAAFISRQQLAAVIKQTVSDQADSQ